MKPDRSSASYQDQLTGSVPNSIRISSGLICLCEQHNPYRSAHVKGGCIVKGNSLINGLIEHTVAAFSLSFWICAVFALCLWQVPFVKFLAVEHFNQLGGTVQN